MRRRTTLQSILDIFSPLRAFAFILALAFVFFIASLPIQTTSAGVKTLNVDAAGSCKDPGHYNSSNCSEIADCCQKWVPASDPRCTDPGPGGGCCLSYGEQCNDPDTPPSPPAIIGSLTCAQWGNKGWCVNTLNLNLSASDPQGQSVILSGNINGIAFACPGGATSCTVPITSDGTGVAAFTVTSATGLSASGSINYALDATTPQIDGSVSGTSGSNGWYVSDVTLSASASDAASGIASFQYSLDNATWTDYSSSLTLSDGVHTIGFRAIDNAGNQRETSQTLNIDTLTPNLDLSITSSPGSNGWYRSNVQVSAIASDTGSGLAGLEYSLDAGAWTAYSSPLTLTNGTHGLSVRAMDAAGNVTQTDQQIKIDSTTPTINLTVAGTTGLSGWYVSNVEVSASGADTGSGLASFDYSLNDSPWTPYTNALPYSDGRYSLKFRAMDIAGNVIVTPSQTYSIDTIPPALDLPESTKLGKRVEYGAEDIGSGLSALRVVIEDEDERWPKIAWDEYPTGTKHHSDFLWDGKFKDGTKAPEGLYYATLKVSDIAGNESRQTASIEVENSLLTLILPAFNPPANTPVPTDVSPSSGATSFGGETNDEMGDPQTGSFTTGGQNNEVHADNLGSVSFGAESTSKANGTDASNILWGVTAAAAVGAFLAEEAERKRKGDEAARLEHIEKTDRGDGLSYREIGRAYQASLDNFRAVLKQAEEMGLSAQEAAKLKQDIITSGKIGASLGSVRVYIQDEERKRAEEEAQRAQESAQKQYEDWLRTGNNPPPGYEDVTDAERAAMYMQTPEVQARLEAQRAWEAERQFEQFQAKAEEEVPVPPANAQWWEDTKSFVNENIIQPFNTSIFQVYLEPIAEKRNDVLGALLSWVDTQVYQPVVEPALEKLGEWTTAAGAWANEKIVEPFVAPALQKAIQGLTTAVSWTNANLYKPYIQPWVEQQVKSATAAIAWANEHVYRPYIEPVVSVVNKEIYQPYAKPLIEAASQTTAAISSWVDENVYEPFIRPVASDIVQYVYQPTVDKATAWWDKYGEWVHNSLDAVGLIPGLGDVADGLNGLIYLGEGHYLEAGVSLLSMIPIIGDFSKAGKLGLKIGEEVLEEAAEKVAKEVVEEVVEKAAKETLEEAAEEIAEKTLREAGEELAEKAARESLEEAAEKTVEKALGEAGEELTGRAVKESLEEASEKAVKEVSQELIEKGAREVAEKTAKVTTEETISKVVKNTIGETSSTLTKEVSETVAQQATKEVVGEISSETTHRVLQDVVEGKVSKLPADVAANLTDDSAKELAEKISKELGGKKVWVSAKTGSMYVSSPPPGAWELVKRLKETDLTNTDEVEKILRQIAELTSRGSGNHVVLGPFKPRGTFIQEALDTDGVFWDVGDELWDALEDTGVDMFKLNDQFLRLHIERGIDRFDVINTNVAKVIDDFNVDPPKEWEEILYREKEILDLASMPDIPYELKGNSWTRVSQ